MKRLIGFGLSLAIVAVAGATAVEANCIPSQTVGTNGFLLWYNGSPFPTSVSEFRGNFWVTGDKGGFGDGSNLPIQQWLYHYTGYPGWFFLRANLGLAVIPGCPADGSDITVVMDNCRTNEAMVMTTTHRPQYGAPQWDFAYYSFGTYVYAYNDSSPRPRITTSSRDGTNINVSYSVPTMANTVFDDQGTGAITSLGVYSIAGATEPDINDVTAWTLRTTGSAAGATGSAVLDCSNTTVDQWLATGIIVGADTEVQLTCPVRVECDPTLANPGGPGPGLKKIGRPRGNPQRER